MFNNSTFIMDYISGPLISFFNPTFDRGIHVLPVIAAKDADDSMEKGTT